MLPSSPQTLTLGCRPELARCHAAEHPAILWLQVQWELARCHAATQPGDIDLNSRAACSDRFAKRFKQSLQDGAQPSRLRPLILWRMLQPGFAAARPAVVNLWLQVQRELARCHAATQPGDIDLNSRAACSDRFAKRFKQSLQDGAQPSRLRPLTLGECFNQACKVLRWSAACGPLANASTRTRQALRCRAACSHRPLAKAPTRACKVMRC